MARITTYSEITNSHGTTTLKDADLLYVYGESGSRKITAKEAAQGLAEMIFKNSEAVGDGYAKNGMYRGANLGSGKTFDSASTSRQRSAISSGTFDGLYIGDYWTVNDKVYRIAHFNYWKNTGNKRLRANHVVLVPDNIGSSYSRSMNDTNTTVGAYVGSKMYSDSGSVLNTFRRAVAEDFGGYLLTHREYLPNAVTNAAQSAGAWYDSTVELMNEIMVYGHHVYCRKYNGAYLDTIDKSQLALFRLNPAMVNTRYGYWLRDVSSAMSFTYISGVGYASFVSSSASYYIRPAFAVKGTA